MSSHSGPDRPEGIGSWDMRVPQVLTVVMRCRGRLFVGRLCRGCLFAYFPEIARVDGGGSRLHPARKG